MDHMSTLETLECLSNALARHVCTTMLELEEILYALVKIRESYKSAIILGSEQRAWFTLIWFLSVPNRCITQVL